MLSARQRGCRTPWNPQMALNACSTATGIAAAEEVAAMSDPIDPAGRQALRGDVVAPGIIVAALLFFVTFAAEAVPLAVGVLRDRTSAPDGVLAAALLLNVALLLFCWRTRAAQVQTVRH